MTRRGPRLPLRPMVTGLLLLQRAHRADTNERGDDTACLREPYPGEDTRMLAKGSSARAQPASCIERPREHGGALCPECLKAIMNGNIEHQPLACTTCSEEHGFDCSCSCASLEATILAGALGDSYRWSVDFRVGRQLLAERGSAAAMPWFDAGFRKRRGVSREECAATVGCEAHEAHAYLNSAVHHKVEHDMEQMEYIVQKYSAPASRSTMVPQEILQVAIELPKYRELLKESPERSLIGLFGSRKDEWHNGYSARQFDRYGIDEHFNRLIWRPPLPGLPTIENSGQGAAAALLSPRDWRLVELQWAANSRDHPAIIVLDDVLRPEVMRRIQEHMLESTYWFEAKQHKSAGYLGAYLGDGFASQLLLQVAQALQEAMPSIVGHLPLYDMWAYKHRSSFEGVKVHADPSNVTMSFWTTPDTANLDPKSGGLGVYKARYPIGWSWEKHNSYVKNHQEVNQLIRQDGRPATIIPYRYNRLVIFPSDVFHYSDQFKFKSGYKNRRINLTYLFGKSETDTP